MKLSYIMLIERIKGTRQRLSLQKWGESCFPVSERPMITELVKKGDLSAYYKNGKFIGASYSTIIFNNIAFLFYFGLLPEYRNLGYGSKIFSYLKNIKYKNYNIVFLIRNPYIQCKDSDIRWKRYHFYKKNGFIPLYEYKFQSIYKDSSFFGIGLKHMSKEIFMNVICAAEKFYNEI